MSSRRGGLGRGLAALIPPAHEADDPATSIPTPPARGDQNGPAAAGDGQQPSRWPPAGPTRTGPPADPAVADAAPITASVAEVPTEAIDPNRRQPREVFDEEELEGLAVSLRDIGLLQPLVVRPQRDGRYELIAGEGRLRAARIAGFEQVPVLIRHTDDADLLKEALVENIHRVQLNPLEEAAAYQQLLEEFGFTQEELAARLGRSRPAISNTLRLLSLPPGVQRRVAAGVLSAGHAKALLAIEDHAVLQRLADRVIAEGLSVRATEELVRLRVLDEADTPQHPRRTRRRQVTAPGLVELQEDLSDALMAKVRITMGARRGKVAIEFASIDDLERIVGVIAKGLDGQAPAAGRTAPLTAVPGATDQQPGAPSADGSAG